jgi:site-specific DNA recombinase
MTSAALAAPLALQFVALYCRISSDPRKRGESVAAQEQWGRAYAARIWPGMPVRVFVDNDMSGADGGPRPGFIALLGAVGAGQVAHLWVVEQSRLTRGEVEWFELAAALDAAGVTELHTDREGIVRVRDDVAGIKAVINAGEVRKMKRRLNDRLDVLAAEGRPAGADMFGYRHALDGDGGKTLRQVPAEAEAIRWAAGAVLDGWSLANVAAELDGRGLRGVHGGQLNGDKVRKILTSPTIAGHRVHRGKVVGRGVWEPILEPETWDALRHRLGQRRTVARADGGVRVVSTTRERTGRRYVLTGGLAVCGVCDAAMIGTNKQLKSGKTRPYLICHPSKGGRSCTGILLEETEHYVAEQLFAELDNPAFRAALVADDHAARREDITAALAELERQREELAGEWATPGALTMAEWRAARQGLDAQESVLRAELAEVPPPAIGDKIDGAAEAWPDMTLDERRAFLRLFVARVTVNRAPRGARVFDGVARVKIEWRTV